MCEILLSKLFQNFLFHNVDLIGGIIYTRTILLIQQISRLLAALYVLSTSLKQFSLSPDEEGSESRWASFFHQASLGAHLNQQIISDIVQKKQKAARDTEVGSPGISLLQISDCRVLVL